MIRTLLPVLLMAACVRVPKAEGTGLVDDEDTLVVVTFNTGTSEGVVDGPDGEDGYGTHQAELSDTWYGDGLAWSSAVEQTADWFGRFEPDVVVFQELFWSGACPDIPEEAQEGFVCADWQPGDNTVAQTILGPDYQIACHPGKPDKCAAVHARIGTFDGCTDAFCLEGLRGATVEGCGSGARVATGTIVDTDGEPVLQLTNLHGSSGLSVDDQNCRIAQTAQVFDAIADGPPAVSPSLPDIVMGDLNTDPGRFAELDASAAEWASRVPLDTTEPRSHGLYFITPVGPDAPGSYGGIADIDHILSDAWTGACDRTLVDVEQPHPVYAPAYFDHRPIVCALRRR